MDVIPRTLHLRRRSSDRNLTFRNIDCIATELRFIRPYER